MSASLRSLPSARRAALARMIASKYHIDAFAPHADGERVAVAASALTGNVWDGAVLLLKCAGAEPELVGSLARGAGVADVAWLGAETVVSGDDAGDVSLWPCAALSAAAPASADAEALDAALEPTAKFGGHTGAVTCVCATESPRQQLASGSLDGTVMVWETGVAREAPLHTLPHRVRAEPWRDVQVRALCWAAPATLASAASDGAVRLWDVRAPSPLAAQVQAAPVALRSLCPTAGGGGGGLFVGTEAGEVVELDCRSASCAVMRRAATFPAPVGSLAVAPGIVAAGADDGSVALLDVSNSLSTVRKFAPHTDFVRALCWLPRTDWPSLLSGGWDRKILLHADPGNAMST